MPGPPRPGRRRSSPEAGRGLGAARPSCILGNPAGAVSRAPIQPVAERKEPLQMSDVAEFAETVGASKERHPRGLYILFATELWERFGFYTAAAMMTLYLQRGGFGWSKNDATRLWSNYLMFVYATPLIGGWLADKFLGYRRAVIIGGLLFIGGYALLAQGSLATYYIALGLIFAGHGFL